MKKASFSVLVTLFLLFPYAAKALPTGLPWGGYSSAPGIVCTCPPFGMLLTYSPLFLSSSIPTAGFMWYSPISVLFAYFQVGVPTTWSLGAYSPGGVCNIISPATGCTPPLLSIPAVGTVLYMGTSMPGASPK